MGSIKKTVVELFLLGVLSIGLALGVNAIRSSRSIKLTKNYFAKSAETQGDAGSRPAQSDPDVPPPAVSLAKSTESSRSPHSTEPPASGPTAGAAAEVTKTKRLEHDYQEIGFEEVVEVFKDPGTKQGLNVFVDARKHEDYERGHIPGAVHCDPYEAEKTIDDVMARTNGVERVIVYCGGGDCEDSIFMCRELIEAGAPQDSVYLYPGGWTEWTAHNMPTEMGDAD